MSPPNATQAHYQLRYKAEQQELFQWMIKTSSNLYELYPSSSVGAIVDRPIPKPSCLGIQTLAAFIGEHIQPVPDEIFTLFERVINDRKKTYQDYQQATLTCPDPHIKRYNDMHRRWLLGLTNAFHSLGGKEWRAQASLSVTKKDPQQSLFSNRFSVLAIDERVEEEEGKAGRVAHDGQDSGSDLFDPFAGHRNDDNFFDPAARQYWTWKPARKKKKKVTPKQKENVELSPHLSSR